MRRKTIMAARGIGLFLLCSIALGSEAFAAGGEKSAIWGVPIPLGGCRSLLLEHSERPFFLGQPALEPNEL